MGRTKIVSTRLVDGGVVAVSLLDEQFPHLQVDLRFEDADDALPLDSVCVQRNTTDLKPHPAISTEELRAGFPWTTWERAARAAAANHLMGLYADRHPGLTPSGFFEPRGSFDALLLRVAEEYRANVVAGAHNPAALIAEKHGVKPGTARSWLHQARRLGLLGPAADRAAGEVGAPSVLARKRGAAKRRTAQGPDNMTSEEEKPEMPLDEDEKEWLVIPTKIPTEIRRHPVEVPPEEPAEPQTVGQTTETSESGRKDQ